MKSIHELWQNDSNDGPLVIAGPCSAESEDQVLASARELSGYGVGVYRAGIWKPRTKPGGFEGVGSIGLEWLKRVKSETGIQVSTEVATKEHVRMSLEAGIDMLWIGARTSVNPFAVQEIADALKESDIPVLVKNPVNPDLELWIGAIERFRGVGLSRVGAVHRGFCTHEKTKYRNTPLWDIPLELRNRIPDIPIICDPSHIAGDRDYIEHLSREAIELGMNGLMIESHISPETAWSDAKQQLKPSELSKILDGTVNRSGKSDGKNLGVLRERIDEIDEQMLALLARRMKICSEIGTLKKELKMPIVQMNRFGELIENRMNLCESLDLNPDFVKEILKDIHEESVRRQMLV